LIASLPFQHPVTGYSALTLPAPAACPFMHAISADVRASFPLELTTIPAQEQFQSSAAAQDLKNTQFCRSCSHVNR
jgi:hypothetical protein